MGEKEKEIEEAYIRRHSRRIMYKLFIYIIFIPTLLETGVTYRWNMMK